MDKSIIQSADLYEITTVDVLVFTTGKSYTEECQNVEYSFNRLTDTVLLHGEAEQCSAAAAHLYTERYL